MRLLLFSDVQGELAALESLLQSAARLGGCDLVCLGNAVGAGPDPQGTVERMRKKGVALIAGPRDLAALGKPVPSSLVEEGAANARRLAPADVAYLRHAAAPRRLVVAGRQILLTSDPGAEDPRAFVVRPGLAPALAERWASVGSVHGSAGEAPYLLVDGETGALALRRAIWDAAANPAR